jgi:hypothetical protein
MTKWILNRYGTKWIILAQDRDWYQMLVNTVMNLGLMGNSVTNCAEISFMRRTVFYRVGCFVSYRCLDI